MYKVCAINAKVSLNIVTVYKVLVLSSLTFSLILVHNISY